MKPAFEMMVTAPPSLKEVICQHFDGADAIQSSTMKEEPLVMQPLLGKRQMAEPTSALNSQEQMVEKPTESEKLTMLDKPVDSSNRTSNQPENNRKRQKVNEAVMKPPKATR